MVSHVCPPPYEPVLDPGPSLKVQVPALVRECDAFTPQAYQKNTKPRSPPKTDFLCAQGEIGKTFFKELCRRGDVPVHLGNAKGEYGYELLWQTDIEKLDFDYYIPFFLEGILETEHPYNYFAYRGSMELMYAHRCEMLRLLPKIMPHFIRAFKSRVQSIVLTALHLFRHLICLEPRIGPALVRYYRYILPIFNFYYNDYRYAKDPNKRNLDYSERDRRDIQRELASILELMEKTAGPQAYSEIKHYLQAYESAFF